MILLHRSVPKEGPAGPQIILIFGLGLIGRSILQALQLQARLFAGELPFSWVPGPRQDADAERIIMGIVASTRGYPAVHAPTRIDVVWSAGRAGFTATKEQLDGELRSFSTVLALASRLRELYPTVAHGFHLISSAGGLFEGQCAVTAGAIPNPRRPYGEAKMVQEQQVQHGLKGTAVKIYRPSSVYGFVSSRTRQGLITTLILRGIRGEVTRVFGRPGTLRDYVLASDVGRFVAEQLFRPLNGSAIYLLASGRPSTILELVHLTENLLGRRLYLSFQSTTDNTEHQTFHMNALPPNWHPTDLHAGIERTRLQVLAH